MKVLHLVCNSHIDPVWMWDWDEGIDAALSTFYSAAQLAGQYDYIFCHNEAFLYEYIEKYDKKLFDRICELVKQGKWHIMGGWYIQPDCMLPSGESFIRQITLGREYFSEKFGKEPTVAINFDSFGHTRGLVQILKRCGYNGYIFCRPMSEIQELPDHPFFWKGYDGSKIKALRVNDATIYCSDFGETKQAILRKAKVFDTQDVGIALWGVGNHGGGPSRKDLADIEELQKELKNKIKIIHSTPENYFKDAECKSVYLEDLPCFRKSYSSISLIKQKHAELENLLFAIEKACSCADIFSSYDYNVSVFRYAEKILCAMEFHDVLSGTCVEGGLKSTVIKADAAIEKLKEEFYRAFHSLADNRPEAEEGEHPFYIFNFQPYEYVAPIETELLILKSLVSDTEMYKISVYQNGEKIPSQVIKENSNINYDRRKRIAYVPRLNSLGISNVVVKYEKAAGNPNKPEYSDGDIVFNDNVKTVVISAKTGLISSFKFDGKEYLSKDAFLPVAYEDNADPWGWYLHKVGNKYSPFKISDINHGVFEGLKSVNIIEDGDVFTEVETVMYYSSSFAKINYKIYKNFPYIDVGLKVFWNEKGKGLKIKIPTMSSGKYFGQVAYGKHFYNCDGNENVAHRYVGVELGEKCFVVFSSGIYGNSKKGKDLYLNLFNGSAYCAHPIEDRPLLDNSRYNPYIEYGVHDFSFRLAICDSRDCEKFAQEFINTPYSVNMYPHGNGYGKEDVYIESDGVVLSSFRKSKKGFYVLRLFNNNGENADCKVKIGNLLDSFLIKKYSFITLLYDGKSLTESIRSDIY